MAMVKGVRVTFFYVFIVCLTCAATSAAASNKLPDLIPVVINVDQGLIEVRNIGEAAAESSQVYVNCSVILAGKTRPCADGLQLPGYIKKWNVLSYDIAALQPGEHYRFHVFGTDAFPRRVGVYGMSISADSRKHIAESNEKNNATYLSTVFNKGDPALARYSDLRSDQIVSAGEEKGMLKIKVLMAGKPIAAAILVTQAGKRNKVVLQTKSRHADTYKHMKQTPFDVFLPAGRYDLYVQARVSPLRITMQTRMLPVVIKAGKRLDRTVTIPSGRLQISSSIAGEDVAGLKLEISGGASYRDKLPDFDGYTIYQQLKTPLDADVPPGKYKITVRNPETRQVQTINAVIKAGHVFEKSLTFNKYHAGYLTFNLLVDGKKIPAKDFYRYVALTITSTTTSKQIKPGSGERLRLPSDVYDVAIHEQAWGNADRHLTGIKISDDKVTERTIRLQQPGELQLVSRWQSNKLEKAECAVIKPVMTAAVIPIYAYLYATGTKVDLGQHGDRAKCDPYVNPLLVTYTRLDKNDNRTTEPEKVYSAEYSSMNARVAAIRLLPGRYDFKLWPLKHKELQQTLKNIKIESDKAVLKELVFDPPDQ